MAKIRVRLPGFFELSKPKDTFVALKSVLEDDRLLGEVVASQFATADRLEAQAEQCRLVADALKQLAARKRKGGKGK